MCESIEDLSTSISEIRELLHSTPFESSVDAVATDGDQSGDQYIGTSVDAPTGTSVDIPSSEVSTGNKKGSALDYMITPYTEEYRPPKWDEREMWYLGYQREICPTTGLHHWQGFVQYIERKTIKQSQYLLCCGKCNHQSRRGTPQRAAEYCSKEESRVPGSIPSKFGFLQPRIKGVNANSIYYNHLKREGHSDTSLLNELKVADIVSRKRVSPKGPSYDGLRLTYVVTGVTGVGKSYLMACIARRIADRCGWKVYLKNDQEWWQHYNSEEVVIMNEFDGKYPFNDFKLLADPGSFECMCKGGSYYSNVRILLITSNNPIDTWYPNEKMRDAALRRARRNCWVLMVQTMQKELIKEIIEKIVADIVATRKLDDEEMCDLEKYTDKCIDDIVIEGKINDPQGYREFDKDVSSTTQSTHDVQQYSCDDTATMEIEPTTEQPSYDMNATDNDQHTPLKDMERIETTSNCSPFTRAVVERINRSSPINEDRITPYLQSLEDNYTPEHVLPPSPSSINFQRSQMRKARRVIPYPAYTLPHDSSAADNSPPPPPIPSPSPILARAPLHPPPPPPIPSPSPILPPAPLHPSSPPPSSPPQQYPNSPTVVVQSVGPVKTTSPYIEKSFRLSDKLIDEVTQKKSIVVWVNRNHSKYYLVFHNLLALENFLLTNIKDLEEGKVCMDEVCLHNMQKPKIDIDCKKSAFSNVSDDFTEGGHVLMLLSIISNFCNSLSIALDRKVDHEELLCYSSCRNNKLSFHLVFPEGRLPLYVCKMLAERTCANLCAAYRSFVDLQIYTKKHCFRMYGSCKFIYPVELATMKKKSLY